jgi:hypothetical protein
MPYTHDPRYKNLSFQTRTKAKGKDGDSVMTGIYAQKCELGNRIRLNPRDAGDECNVLSLMEIPLQDLPAFIRMLQEFLTGEPQEQPANFYTSQAHETLFITLDNDSPLADVLGNPTAPDFLKDFHRHTTRHGTDVLVYDLPLYYAGDLVKFLDSRSDSAAYANDKRTATAAAELADDIRENWGSMFEDEEDAPEEEPQQEAQGFYIEGADHSIYHERVKEAFNFVDAEHIDGKHPMGRVYVNGEFGYIANGYGWIRFLLKHLDAITSTE